MRDRNHRWRPIITMVLLLGTLLPSRALATPPVRPDAAVVETADGPIRGEVGDGYRVFRGLPFAAPPVGERRWLAPRPVTPWTVTRPATASGPPCVQPPDFLIGELSSDEDCLYLEVTTPDTATNANPRPVMVWLHGGAFVGGAGSLADPHRLALAGDVVVVTINYRLGVFGFLSFPGLEGSGTFGLQDQQAALQWVQRNIAAFGGDPGNVTLFGESAGGLSTCAQLASPGARGLFHKAIIQSGPCSLAWPPNGLFPNFPAGSAFIPLADSVRLGTALATTYRCFLPTAGIACLRQVAAEALRDNQLGYLFATPVYETPTLPRAPVAALTDGDFPAIPIIIGATRDEMLPFFAEYFTTKPLTVAAFRQLLFTAFGDEVHAIAALYGDIARESPALAWTTIMTDRVFACPTLRTAEQLAVRAPVYAYEFADPDPPQPEPTLGIPAGAYHASEVQYLLDRTGEPPLLDPAQLELSTSMIDYWTTFAHTGDPNQPGLPEWTPFDPASAAPVVLSLKPGPDGIAPVDYAAVHNCYFWATLETG